MSEPSIGFACLWGPHPRDTWSGTPWNLRGAMQPIADVVDLSVEPASWQQTAAKVTATRYAGGRWYSPWKQSRLGRSVIERTARARADALRPDTVLEIGDLAVFRQPFGIVQDLSFRLLLDNVEDGRVRHFPGLSVRRIRQLRHRQQRVFAGASLLFPMSEWLARSMVTEGVPPAKIHVNPPGVVVPRPPDAELQRRVEGPRNRLLFVGRDFETKCGAQVVAALELLRRSGETSVSLTVIGPPAWPLESPIPDGVRFLGSLPHEQVLAQMREHDLFVMPSIFEGYGIVFAEALALGLPCVARDRCAMPEIVNTGVDGLLIGADATDPTTLADRIGEALRSDAIYANAMRAARSAERERTWERSARTVVEAFRAL
jgi:glycosyltransferase involved in cell wall biosynthesis